MKKTKYDTVRRRHTLVTFLGIAVLTFLILVSIAGATQDSDVWIAKGNAIADLGKYDEAIKAYDKLIELNPNDSGAWNKKVAALNKSNLIVVNLNKG